MVTTSVSLTEQENAALADMAYIPHVSPSGKTAEIAKMLRAWNVPLV